MKFNVPREQIPWHPTVDAEACICPVEAVKFPPLTILKDYITRE
ncbi:MAG: hypothetical protein AB1331_04400 [Bacillota bacterium]